MSQIVVSTPGTEDKRTVRCDRDELTIGRASDSDIVLPTTSVSRHHASLIRENADLFFVVDQGSENGTQLNGTVLRPHERYVLRNGDTLTIEGHHLQFVRTDDLEQSFNEITDSDIMEVKLLKKVLRALDRDTLPSLEVMNGLATGKKVFFRDDAEALIVGRDASCDLAIEEYAVSRRHAQVRRDGDQVIITDLQSKNGTYINQHRLTDAQTLHDGDRVAFGTVVCIYRNPREVNLEAMSADVKKHRTDTQQAIEEKTKQHRIEPAAEEAFADDAESAEATGSAEAMDEPSAASQEHANLYPTPQPAHGWLDRMSAAEMGLLWTGIVVFLVASILLVRLVM